VIDGALPQRSPTNVGAWNPPEPARPVPRGARQPARFGTDPAVDANLSIVRSRLLLLQVARLVTNLVVCLSLGAATRATRVGHGVEHSDEPGRALVPSADHQEAPARSTGAASPALDGPTAVRSTWPRTGVGTDLSRCPHTRTGQTRLKTQDLRPSSKNLASLGGGASVNGELSPGDV
jgi:hypothetical protein